MLSSYSCWFCMFVLLRVVHASRHDFQHVSLEIARFKVEVCYHKNRYIKASCAHTSPELCGVEAPTWDLLNANKATRDAEVQFPSLPQWEWECQIKAFIPPNIGLEDRASHWLEGIYFFPPPSGVWEPEEGQGNSVCQGKAVRVNEERRMDVGLKVYCSVGHPSHCSQHGWA